MKIRELALAAVIVAALLFFVWPTKTAWSGVGSSQIDGVKLNQGVNIFFVTHEAFEDEQTLTITLEDESGDFSEVLADAVSYTDYSYKNLSVVSVPEKGSYKISIEGAGSWNLEQQELSTSPSSGPHFEGEGTQSLGFVNLSGPTLFKTRHWGYEDIYIDIYDEKGELFEYLLSDYGQYVGELATTFKQGPYLVNVIASGRWDIELSELEAVEELGLLEAKDDKASPLFPLEEGFYTLKVNYEGVQNDYELDQMIVYLYKEGEGFYDTLLEKYEPFSGTATGVYLEEGNYFFQVLAEGDWSLEFPLFEGGAPADELTAFSGTNNEISPAFSFSGGDMIVSFSLEGEDYDALQVELLTEEGHFFDYVLDDWIEGFSPLTGSTTLTGLPAGNYRFNVAADGPWTLNIND